MLPTEISRLGYRRESIFFANRHFSRQVFSVLLSQTDLAEIVARSAGLAERLRKEDASARVDEAVGARRLMRWKELSAGSDPERFSAQLEIHRLKHATDEELRIRLGAVRPPTCDPLPAWASCLGQISAAVAKSAEGVQQAMGPHGPLRRGVRRIPYEDLYWPIIKCAWSQIENTNPEIRSGFSQRAKLGLEQHLLGRISTIFSSTVHAAFLAHKSFGSFAMLRQSPFGVMREDDAGSGQHLYRSFVIEQTRDGLRSLFMRYPVAAKLIAQVTLYWIDFVREFLRRLDDDRHELAKQFNDGSPVGPLLSIRAGVSDPHNEGRSVLIVGFPGGLKLVYKPRPLAVDRHFFALIAELNARRPVPGLRVLNMLDRGEYGWMEFAHPAPCQSQEAAARYFHRAGALACLVHWLQGIDFHRENVVASGDHPVLVDLEALAHSPRPEERSADADTSAYGSLACSVLRTGLLPLRQAKYQGAVHYDLSGFGAPVRAPGVVASYRWINVNTDQMQRMLVKCRRRHAAHRARFKGRLLSIRSHERKVVQGYRQLADLLTNGGRHDFTSWRNQIRRTVRRRIKRPTLIYGVLLQASLEPKCLMDGIDRSIELMALPCASGDEDEWMHEIESLEKLDVPYFRQSAKPEFDTSELQQRQRSPDLLGQANIVKLALRDRLCLNAGAICKMSDLRKRRVAGRDHPVSGG